jgi:ATP-binding cassette, subfamily B, bacterial
MSLLSHFNKVLLIEAGRCVDFGTVAELTARQALFRELLHGNQGAVAVEAESAALA